MSVHLDAREYRPNEQGHITVPTDGCQFVEQAISPPVGNVAFTGLRSFAFMIINTREGGRSRVRRVRAHRQSSDDGVGVQLAYGGDGGPSSDRAAWTDAGGDDPHSRRWPR